MLRKGIWCVGCQRFSHNHPTAMDDAAEASESPEVKQERISAFSKQIFDAVELALNNPHNCLTTIKEALNVSCKVNYESYIGIRL